MIFITYKFLKKMKQIHINLILGIIFSWSAACLIIDSLMANIKL